MIFEPNQRKYAYNANIIVGTPGRVMDLMEPKNGKVGLEFGDVDHFVLDEADRLMDQGFSEDMYKIHTEIVKQRFDSDCIIFSNFLFREAAERKEPLQSLMLSATFEDCIQDMAKDRIYLC